MIVCFNFLALGNVIFSQVPFSVTKVVLYYCHYYCVLLYVYLHTVYSFTVYRLHLVIVHISTGGSTSSDLLQPILARSNVTTSQAYAKATWNNLSRHWRSFTQFCKYFSVQPLPLQPYVVQSFLQLYSESVSCYSTVNNVFSSLKTMSKLHGDALQQIGR